MKRLTLIVLSLFWLSPALAENMLMLRVPLGFDDTMIALKDKLEDYGYRIAHIQKCDTGLGDAGYETDNYKSIFFGKQDEVRKLSAKYPQIIPFLPLKMAVIKEMDSVVLSMLNPTQLNEYHPEKALQLQFYRWESDIRAIFAEMQSIKPL